MEIDRSIALFEREQKNAEEMEKIREMRAAADPRKRISYTVEELAKGIKGGKLYLYTLKLHFEPREILGGKIRIPFIQNCFDIMEEMQDHELCISQKRKISLLSACAPSVEPGDFQTWAEKVKDGVELSGLKLKNLQFRSAGLIDYMIYEVASAEGLIYNIHFRFWKDACIYTGVWNCMEEEKDGWGLLLEAMLHVMGEMNCQEGGAHGIE